MADALADTTSNASQLADEMAVSDAQVLSAADMLADSQDPEAGEWVTKAQAAVRLGISQRTLDRKLAQGQLRKRIRGDQSVEVFVPMPETVADEMTATRQTERSLAVVERFNEAVASQLVPLLEQQERLIEKVACQAEEIGRLKTFELENERLKAELEQLRQTQGQTRPWWRFW